MSDSNKPSHYHAFEITEKGMKLRQLAVAGAKDGQTYTIEFIRGAIGQGWPDQGADVFLMTDLVDHIADVPIKESYAEHVSHLMSIVIDNSGLTEEVLMTEVGIFARILNSKTGEVVFPEILYGYTYTFKYDYIPAATDYFVYREICFNTVLSREGKFEVVFDRNKVYLTHRDFEGYLKTLESKKGAGSIGYDNGKSGLAAANVQDAIDEVLLIRVNRLYKLFKLMPLEERDYDDEYFPLMPVDGGYFDTDFGDSIVVDGKEPMIPYAANKHIDASGFDTEYFNDIFGGGNIGSGNITTIDGGIF